MQDGGRPIFTTFGMVTLNPSGSTELLSAAQTRVRPKNIVVAGAHWRILANIIEPSMRSAKGWAA